VANDVSFPYLAQNYTAGSEVFVPIISDMNQFSLVVNGESAVIDISDISSVAESKILSSSTESDSKYSSEDTIDISTTSSVFMIAPHTVIMNARIDVSGSAETEFTINSDYSSSYIDPLNECQAATIVYGANYCGVRFSSTDALVYQALVDSQALYESTLVGYETALKNAIDHKNRVIITYLNDGFDISGDSLNPMETKQIPGPEKYEGLITVTQAAKYRDIWIAEDGGEFERNESGAFYLINESFKRLVDTEKTMMNRNHSEFDTLIENETNRAAQILSEQLCKRCSDEPFAEINDIFAYDYPTTIPKSEDHKIQAALIAENLKAQQILNQNNNS